MTRTTNPRTIGKRRIRTVTGVAVVGAVLGTGAMAFFVGHEYAGKSTAGASTPSASSAQYSDPSTSTPSAEQQWGDDAEQYQDPSQGSQQYQDPSQGSQQYQSGPSASQLQPPSGQGPQATTGGS